MAVTVAVLVTVPNVDEATTTATVYWAEEPAAIVPNVQMG